ncbi:cysteine synthase A [Tumebacillus sp. ITR2]|uniref:Cysteine synthase n=1 Tax=Tumebacillus amylolyticus TaxID=2801339 RepID=A0ABS1JBR8_9BACL|nr:cysteine synthase A [Tumebacillus amylolyticus]MBL0387713.1 cysteine synthase A [Tumebacillus amylolyticus]
MKVVHNISELIGDTPVVKLNRLVTAEMADVYVKLEMFNPSRSVKDRAASNMIFEAERLGLLQAGDTIIEPTSGNTGIGLAMVGAAKGYRVILVMPDTCTKERIAILKAYGAEVVLSPGPERMNGAVAVAKRLASEISGSFVPMQFENLHNPDIHRRTTAQEIFQQMEGRLDAFVATAGTGGTITGTGETLKDLIPGLQVFVVEPESSAVLSGEPSGSHKIVGTSPGFIPPILNQNVYQEIFKIKDHEAQETTRRLAREEGILVGTSSGASVHTALQVARRLGPGHRVLCIAPDTGERYLSSDLFASDSEKEC